MDRLLAEVPPLKVCCVPPCVAYAPFLLAPLLAALQESAVALTPNQLSSLKADILADPVLAAQFESPDGRFAIAVAYNVVAGPDYWVWKTYVTKNDVVSSTSVDGTTFNWTGNGFITRSAGEIAAWENLFNASGSINPSLANVRQAFADIFSGAGNAAANRTHLLAIGRRKATRAEKLFASGSGSTGSPSTMGFEGVLTNADIEAAHNA